MRTLCGRLKSDYRYAKDIVYNNFPWPKPTKEQKEKIEKTAQAIWGAPHRRRVFILFQIYYYVYGRIFGIHNWEKWE